LIYKTRLKIYCRYSIPTFSYALLYAYIF